MTIVVDLQNELEIEPLPAVDEFERWVGAALRQTYTNLEQPICVVDEALSRELNRDYRGKDNATNVLAFPAQNDLLDYDHLGDLVICAPLVASEAAQQGKAEIAHWAHLVVHGMLHLQGYDHQDDVQATTMERVEVEILDTLGYTNPYND